MELQTAMLPSKSSIPLNAKEKVSTSRAFIEANTVESTLSEIKNSHIIPVFIKDNEPLISHYDFIETAGEVVSEIYPRETILKPNIRLSHPVKGRIPEAKNKPANELLEHEKTIYYERMAFVIEIPTINDEIDGNTLSLTLGGVKAYNEDNLYNKKGSDEHFKFFIGFKNQVCTNLCIWTDGYMGDIRISNIGHLKATIKTIIQNYNANFHLFSLKQLSEFSLTEKQFALLAGRCRMYSHLPKGLQAEIPSLSLGENQVSMVVKDYYRDESFCKMDDGSINLWRLYNLFTNANKTTYIDSFLDRSVNAFCFVDQIRMALKEERYNWFIN